MRRTRFKFPVSTLVGSNLENIFSLIKGHRIQPKHRHNLLCQDPKAAYTTTFQTVFPNLVLTQSGWLKPHTNYKFFIYPADFDRIIDQAHRQICIP